MTFVYFNSAKSQYKVLKFFCGDRRIIHIQMSMRYIHTILCLSSQVMHETFKLNKDYRDRQKGVAVC